MKLDVIKYDSQIYDKIIAFVDKCKKDELDDSQVTNGHDITKTLSHFFLVLYATGLRKKHLSTNRKKYIIRTKRSKKENGEKLDEFEKFFREIETELRLAYEFRHFQETELYHSIITYQENHNLEFIKI